MFVIEKGVPLPERRGGEAKYPWKEMSVGDSFVVSNKRMASMAAQAHYASKRLNCKFTVRKLDADKTRVWRIA